MVIIDLILVLLNYKTGNEPKKIVLSYVIAANFKFK